MYFRGFGLNLVNFHNLQNYEFRVHLVRGLLREQALDSKPYNLNINYSNPGLKNLISIDCYFK